MFALLCQSIFKAWWLLRWGSPLTIPNRVVKPNCADGTGFSGRVGRRHIFYKTLVAYRSGGFCVYTFA